MTVDDIEQLSEQERRQGKVRFLIKRDYDGKIVRVGAAQGHNPRAIAMIDTDAMLTRAVKGDCRHRAVMLHGTMRGLADSIAERGLLAGGYKGSQFREHIHMVPQMHRYGKTAGVREGSDTIVMVDFDALMDAGCECFWSVNNVVLTKGLYEKGECVGIPPRFFLGINDVATGQPTQSSSSAEPEASTEAPSNLEYVPVGGFAARCLSRHASKMFGTEVKFQVEVDAFCLRVSKAELCEDDDRKMPMHGKRGANFVCLEKRLRTQDFPYHCPGHSRADKNCTGLLFSLLLDEIEKRGMHMRMNYVPKAARDSARFTGQHSDKFLSSCQPPWPDMTRDQRLFQLQSFMLLKFSTDKCGLKFRPLFNFRYQQAQISWNTFYMTDKEAKDIAKSVMQRYVEEEYLVL
jgi:hypothetical protein